jgi:hypothetical protein
MTERKRGWLTGEVAKRCTLYLPDETYEELRRHCFERRVGMSEFVTGAVKSALGRQRKRVAERG